MKSLLSMSMTLSKEPRTSWPSLSTPQLLRLEWLDSLTGLTGAESVPRSHKKESACKRQGTLQGYLQGI